MSESVEMRWGVKIPLRDGVSLNATLYLPAPARGRAPAIVTMTPYIAQTYHEYGMYFAQNGYPFAIVDVRGRGNSEGVFEPWQQEGLDACDVVRWLSRQPWCDGRVAMWGGSYAGYIQWSAAAQLPAELATIVPAAAPFLAVDFPVRGNIAQTYWMRWLTLVWGKTLQEKLFWNNDRYWGQRFQEWFESGQPFSTLDERLGNPSVHFQRWIAQPRQGTYWDRYNATAEQYARIAIPLLTITGHFDGDQPGALEHYRRHLRSRPAAEHYLVMGPWDHAGTREPQAKFCGIEVGAESLVDLRKLHLDWYAWTMQGGPKPALLRDKVAYYVLGAERWRYAKTVEQITARTQSLYLHSTSNPTDVFHSGSLQEDLPEATEPDRYVHDPRDTSFAALEAEIDPEDRSDQRRVHFMSGRQLVYHSAPFIEDTEISGFFRLTAWIAIDRPDADFLAQVFEIGIDGSSLLLSDDLVRARYRESLREEQLIRTVEPLRYEFAGFMFVSRLVRQGHRLRLVIAPVHSIHFEKNHHSGGVVAQESIDDARVLQVRLYKGRNYPSALQLPIARAED